MAPLKIVLNDRSKQKDTELQENEASKPFRNPFGDGESSDSESEKPKVRQISSFSAAQQQSPSKQPSPPPIPAPPKSGPKGSQIARLLARRKDAAVGLEKESRETRDDALFRYDVDRCDEVATAEGYANRPVEGFGELMLRSMGWKGTPDIEDVSEPTPRPARLGLGAKVEDMPPNLSAKRQKPGMKGMGNARAPDRANANEKHIKGNEEGKGEKPNRDANGYGVTAESSNTAEFQSEYNIGNAKETTAPSDNGEIPPRQRRKRSRFSDR